ncbi:type I polyketide synthase [Schlesneria paludicola]|uniref:type I polyketide synthase n=1 Tax=Schlesneria paludicola TaxID=360056 RepID=UPI00029A9E60|nr:type I polyketide synthase [Schlesneria paludicola]
MNDATRCPADPRFSSDQSLDTQSTMNPSNASAPTPVPLAVVGLSALFPKSGSLDEFWSNIRRGVDTITEVPATHWNPDDYFDANQKTPDMTYARRGGFLSPVPFDPLEFGISPNNLEAIDTSQLLGLVGAKRALEHAGYGADRKFNRSRVGCILGVTGTLEMVIPLGARLGHPRWRKALRDAGVPDVVADDVVNRISQSYVPWQENSFPGLLGNVVAGRIANRLDLHGTNCVVDAACASSLSAIHLAALELSTGRSDMVVTGGIDTFNDIFMFMCFSKTPALSPTGDAKPFSSDADGTILGEGAGIVVLKRLADAERDGDRIYAVLKGIGTSSDGAGSAVYAPKAEGQIRCLEDAYRIAGVSPATVELVEAHGTGTKVGDATEVSGLMHVYKATGRRGAWCAVGSVKSQIGHTKAAAGAAGIIKAILALQHRVLPPTIKVNQPPEPFLADDSPFYVNTVARPWVKPRGYPRRAAVSAFGFGGSNFHCVLEESPQSFGEPEWDGDVQVIALSADQPGPLADALRTSVAPLGRAEWAGVRSFASSSRAAFQVEHRHRLLLVVERQATDLEKLATGAVTMLERYPDKTAWSTPDGAVYGAGIRRGKLGVLFPGQGSQYVGMLRDLVCRFPMMLDVLDQANETFGLAADAAVTRQLSDYIYPHPAFSTETRNQHEAELRATQIAQPAIGAVSLAVLSVLDRFGIRPEAVAGHSYGELTALCASKRFSPEVLYRLSTLRGQMMAASQENEGGMLAVLAPLAQIEAAINELSLDLVVANHNSPTQVVLSGRIPDIDRASSLFASRNIRGKKLTVAAAFHSPLVASAAGTFRPVLDDVEFSPSSMPVYANSTALEYPTEPAAARDLLATQLARPVHFVDEIEQMYADGVRDFLEVGPGGVLTGLVNSILQGRDYRALATDASNGKRNNLTDLATVLATLSASGHSIQWQVWDPQSREGLDQSASQRMRIPICGANYVKPRDPIPARAPLNLVDGTSSTVPASTTPTSTVTPTVVENRAAENPHLAGIVDTIRETLTTLQRMQQETSQLHQQFLDGQEAALKTLTKVANQYLNERHTEANGPVAPVSAPDLRLHSARTEAPAAIAPVPIPSTVPVRAVVAPAVAAEPAKPAASTVSAVMGFDFQTTAPAPASVSLPVPSTVSRTESPVAQVPPVAAPVRRAPEPPVETAPAVTSPLALTVLAVVSEKTGYPVEMLNLEMSLDHDLGIDSIKRVEILSALQERVPNLPAFQPDELGALHTLKDVVRIADARTIGASTSSVPPAPATSQRFVQPSPVPQPAVSAAVPPVQVVAAGQVAQAVSITQPVVAKAPSAGLSLAVLEVVSEKTGYPIEMLNLEMSLDHDLGIDSIKRVEILSALQERVPNLPAFQPEELGALHTLSDVVRIADSRSAGLSVAPAPIAAPMASPVVTVQAAPAPAVAWPQSVSPAGNGNGAASLPSSTSTNPPAVLGPVVLEVVSEKTGYPVEMLNLDMSLDHDLGIDSIKRVEILSALQERVPGLPAFQPEELGALHTLRDVVTLADARSAAAVTAAPSPPTSYAAPAAIMPPSPSVAATASAPAMISTPAMVSSLGPMVLEVVAEKTGYPVEMLNVDMSLDHDLGIDSIKRVEILSALQERVPHLPAFQPDELGALHTLRDVVSLADARMAPKGDSTISLVPASTSVLAPARGAEPPFISHQVSRPVPTPVAAPAALPPAASRVTSPSPAPSANPGTVVNRSIAKVIPLTAAALRPAMKLFPGSEIWITEDGLGLSLLIADQLTDLGFRPRIVNLDEPQTAVVPDGLAGLLIVAPQRGMSERQLWSAVEWVQKVGPKLRQVGKSSPAILATISRLNGSFGFESSQLHDPISGGLAGLAKCAHLEWPEVTARAIDLSQEWSAPHVAAVMLVTELLHEGPVEVGLAPSGPVQLEVVEEPLNDDAGTPPIQPGDVVVVTGGARGVTAETAIAVATAWQPRLVILGRSPEPAPEPEWLVSLSTEAEIKQALLSRAPTGTTPKTIAAQYSQIVAGREVARHLQRLRATGASVVYRAVDIRDATSVRPLLAGIRRDLGVIRGIIHGAGVLADQRIEDKTKEQFDRVYETKVTGLRTLLDCIELRDLRMLGVFSSYTARFGRVGQLDYAMANEVLNKLARQLSVFYPKCRIASFNWGPWDGGMVQGGLKKLFASEGIGLIPTEAGAKLFVNEFSQSANRPVEVLVLAANPSPSASSSAPPRSLPTTAAHATPADVLKSLDAMIPKKGGNHESNKSLGQAVAPPPGHEPTAAESTRALQTDIDLGFKVSFERELDVASNHYLESHVIGGKAVLPVAMIFEWLAHGAIHRNPGLELHGFDDFRVFQGVRLGQHDRVSLRILCGKPVRAGAEFIVPTRLVSHANGRDVIHAGANVVLAPGYPLAPTPVLHISHQRPYSTDLATAYATRLFHGPQLHGLTAIEAISDDGIIVQSRMSPVASTWMAEPIRANWLADPLAIDVALQSIILWSQELRGRPCLPCAVTKYRQFRRALPHQGVRIIIHIQPSTEQMIRCDIEFVDANGQLVARMEGCESVADSSLTMAFQRKRIEG